MSAATAVRCDYCHSDVPASETFHPFGTVTRCRDVAACERRQIRAFDPTIIPDEDMPVPPAAGAPSGARCAVCGASGDLYERVRDQWHCRDRDGCAQRSIEAQYLTAWSDTSPDRLISPADMRAMTAAARPEIPPERTPLAPGEMAALASQDALGRKRR